MFVSLFSVLARPAGSRTDTVSCGALAEQESKSGWYLAASSAPRTALSASDWLCLQKAQGAVEKAECCKGWAEGEKLLWKEAGGDEGRCPQGGEIYGEH